jgi:hypothetical protein
MDMTIHHTDGLTLIQHKKDSTTRTQTYYTTLVIKHKDGELRVEMFSKEPLTFQLGESDE